MQRHCGEIWNALLVIHGYAEAEAPAKQAKIESARTQRAQSLVTRFLQQKGLKETSYDSVPRSTCTRMSFESRGAALDDWTSAFPQVSKCVLLAAFCAACNSKKTDAFTFGAERRGKRRRQYAGSAHISAENEASDNMTGGNVFSLERLAAIFIQICAATSAVFSGVRSEDAAKVLRRRRHASQREALSEVEEFFGDLYFLSAVCRRHLEYFPLYIVRGTFCPYRLNA